MKFSIKTGILLVILVVPVFFYFFVQWQGWHKAEPLLPYYIPKVVEDTIQGEIIIDTTYHQVHFLDFIKTDRTILSENDLRGNICVANLFFATCQKECPIAMNHLLKVNEYCNRFEKLKMLSYSIDPVNDSPEQLKRYAEGLGVNEANWYLLHGTTSVVEEQAREFYLTNQGATIHSNKIVLIDQDQYIRGYYSALIEASIDTLLLDIAVLLNSKKHE